LVSAAGATIPPMTRPAPQYASYPRRQHARWARKASIYQLGAVVLSGLAVLALAARVDLGAGQGMYELAGACLTLALVLFHAHALAVGRATRNAIGAQSEQQIHDVLEQLRPTDTRSRTASAGLVAGTSITSSARRTGWASALRPRLETSTSDTSTGCADKPTRSPAAGVSTPAACSRSSASPASATPSDSPTGC
jgi:hypothetical protein